MPQLVLKRWRILRERKRRLFSLCPNNILGIEYLKAAHRLGFSPQWAAIPRKGAGHDQHGEEKGLMSASYVRHLLEAGDWSEAQKGLPEICLPLYQQAFVSGVAPVRLGNLERNMLALLRTRPLDWLKNLPDVSEGLENRLYAGIRQARSLWNCISWFKPSDIPRAGQEEWRCMAFWE